MDISALLKHWKFRVHKVQLGHYEASRVFEKRHFWLGVPAVVLSTLVGTAVFASLSDFVDEKLLLWPKIILGLLSVTAAMLVSLQTFLRYAEQAESHKVAGARYAHIKHKLEMLEIMPPVDDAQFRHELGLIESAWDTVRAESPNIPSRVWRHMKWEMSSQGGAVPPEPTKGM